MYHVLNFVLGVKVLECKTSCLISCHVEALVDFGFKALNHVLAGSAFELTCLGLINSSFNFAVLAADCILSIHLRLMGRYSILNTHSVPMVYQEVINHHLSIRKEVSASIGATFFEDNVHQTTTSSSYYLLVKLSAENYSPLYQNHRVIRWTHVLASAGITGGESAEINFYRNDN